MSQKSSKPTGKKASNRANFGLKPKDMTPAQRKNWERINKKKH